MHYKKMRDDTDPSRPMDEKQQEERIKVLLAQAESMKRMAFFGIMTATVAVLVAAIVVPMMYSYAIYVQTTLHEEMEFCNQKSKNLRTEFDKFIYLHDRSKRGTGYQFVIHGPPEGLSEAAFASGRRIQRQNYGEAAQHQQPQQGSAPAPAYAPAPQAVAQQPQGGYQAPQPALRPVAEQERCCSCGLGQAGPPGPPGPDGKNGNDGTPGHPGEAGTDASSHPSGGYEQGGCNQACPEGPPGPPGRPGAGGTPGQHGMPGPNGMPGMPGAHGPGGPPGSAGGPGMDGFPGPKGPNGELSEGTPAPGPPGPAGPNGPPGEPGPPGGASPPLPGPPGPPGDAGQEGSPGRAGQPGPNGESGKKGDGGGCAHCPSPRTAPGY